MLEPIPCPSCQSLLRLPTGVATVQCPNCQTILAIEIDAPPPPPPLPTAKAAPLPFGRPTTAPAVPPPPPPAPNRSVPAKRAKLVTEDPYAPAAAEEAPDEDARLREMRRQIRAMDEEKEREEEHLEMLEAHCKTGRLSVHFLMWGVRLYGLAIFFQLLAVAMTAFTMYDYAALLGLTCLSWAGMDSLLFCVGFGFAIAGPMGARHIGIIGLVICVLHTIGGLLQPGNLAIMAGFQGIDSSRGLWSEYLPAQDILGLATNFPLLADHPARFIKGYNWSFPGIVVAALEFTRLVLLALLTQNYASSGKEQELAFRSFHTVNRLFWVVLMTTSFRMAFSALFDWVSPDDMWFQIGMGLHGALTFACYFSLGLTLLLHAQAMNDTIEVIDHRRYADKRDRLDIV